MKKIILKIKKNKGFALLFAVTLSSIVLAIGLGVADISLQELKFDTSATDTNNAFFAADTGIECALMNDKTPSTIFTQGSGATTVSCLGEGIPLTGSFPSWSFVVYPLGSSNTSCAVVSVTKDNVTKSPSILTSVVSKGYSIGDPNCNSTNADRVERELDINY